MVHKREHEKKMRMKKQGARRVRHVVGWEIVVVVLCTNLTTEEVAAVGVMEEDT
jgi:uncharacterized membrane protein